MHGEEDVGMAPLINPQNLPRVVSTLLESTRDEPHIAEQICYALSQLAAGFKDSDTSLFSPYFADIVQALLQQVSDTATAVVQVMKRKADSLYIELPAVLSKINQHQSPHILPSVQVQIQ